MKTAVSGLAIVTLAVASSACFAQARGQQMQDAGWYLGGGIGSSLTSFSAADFANGTATSTQNKTRSPEAIGSRGDRQVGQHDNDRLPLPEGRSSGIGVSRPPSKCD